MNEYGGTSRRMETRVRYELSFEHAWFKFDGVHR